MRYWITAGRGNFALSTKDCLGPEFYCIFYNGPWVAEDPLKGWSVCTSPIPNKRGVFAETKSVNYLQNALNLMDAEDRGYDAGIFVHEDGTLCEGPNLNIGIINKEGFVQVPPFKECLAGCTMQRMLELVPKYRVSPLVTIKGIEQVRCFWQAPGGCVCSITGLPDCCRQSALR